MPKYKVTWVVQGDYSMEVTADNPDFARDVADLHQSPNFGDLRNVDWTDVYIEEVVSG